MSKKVIKQTDAEMVVQGFKPDSEFDSFIQYITSIVKGAIQSLDYIKTKTGVCQNVILKCPDASKLRVSKFIPNDGKVRLSVSTKV